MNILSQNAFNRKLFEAIRMEQCNAINERAFKSLHRVVDSMTVLVELPINFSIDAFMAFHHRDKEVVSEFRKEHTLHKAFMREGVPVLFKFTFDNNCVYVDYHKITSEPVVDKSPTDKQSLLAIANHMLGLNQPTDAFEIKFKGHPQVGRLIQQQSGLRVPQTATPFEALSWAIIGQQISVAAAVSIRRRMIIAAGQTVPNESLHYAYPEPINLLTLGHDGLKACGFSESKASTMIRVCELVIDHDLLPTSVSSHEDVEALTALLSAIKGIGPWTISYALLRGYAWLDGSLHGDVAVRRNLQPFLSLDAPPNAKETEAWLHTFSPWRALMAAHLWQSQSAAGY